jgi:proteasome component ECM29
VLQRLIPAAIAQLRSSHETTRKKVLELLSHVNKRVKSQPALKLPISELLALFTADVPPGEPAASSATVRNFALVYTEIAAERAAPADRLAAVSGGCRGDAGLGCESLGWRA